MLKVTDFNCVVRKDTINGIECWVYIGNSLSDCVDFAKLVRRHGEWFFDPLTAEVSGVHRATLDREMVRLLAAMSHYQDFNDYTTMVYPGDFPVVTSRAARGFTTNYNYLVHFGLLGKEHREDAVHYWVTDKGREFLAGGRSPASLFNTGALVHGIDEAGGTVGMEDFFNQEQQDEMKKPLWFLPQQYREEILTANELKIGV